MTDNRGPRDRVRPARPAAVAGVRELVRDGEAAGYAAVFLPEIGGRDTLAALTGLAGDTSQLRLGHRRRPDDLAAPAAHGDGRRHRARAQSGGGWCWGSGPARRAGRAPRPGGAVASRSVPAPAGEVVAGPGRATLAALPAVPDARRRSGWRRSATGCALAGQVADGILLNWCTPERVRRGAAIATEAAAGGAGRDPAGVTVAVYVRAASGRRGVRSRSRRCRTMPGQYAVLSRTTAGRWQRWASATRQRGRRGAYRRGRPDDVPESLVRALCLLGDRAGARERLDAYREAGPTCRSSTRSSPARRPLVDHGDDARGGAVAAGSTASGRLARRWPA